MCNSLRDGNAIQDVVQKFTRQVRSKRAYEFKIGQDAFTMKMQIVNDLHWTIRACRGNLEAQTMLIDTLKNVLKKCNVDRKDSRIACMLVWSIYACKGNETAQRALLELISIKPFDILIRVRKSTMQRLMRPWPHLRSTIICMEGFRCKHQKLAKKPGAR
ncbi:MAG: hypothetical protein LBP65_02045 [Puniceicoccales bacterium]|jgi:hypothetical protein|nr:hypothetical protein [Puniceicoccales bacterium]